MAILKRTGRRDFFHLQEDDLFTDPLLAQEGAVMIYADPNLLLYSRLQNLCSVYELL